LIESLYSRYVLVLLEILFRVVGLYEFGVFSSITSLLWWWGFVGCCLGFIVGVFNYLDMLVCWVWLVGLVLSVSCFVWWGRSGVACDDCDCLQWWYFVGWCLVLVCGMGV